MQYMPIRVRIRRHAERPTHGEGHGGAHTPLTEAGKQHAFALGKRLKGKQSTYFYSTPVGRSSETARQMARGAGKPTAKIHERADLTQFVKPHSPQEAAEVMRILTPPANEVIHDWLQGKLPPKFFHSPEEVAALAAYTMRHVPTGMGKLYQWHARAVAMEKATGRRVPHRRPYINIEAIGHDITIVALLRALTGKEPTQRNGSYADFLEHAELQFKPKRGKTPVVRLIYRNRQYDVTQKFNELVMKGRRLKAEQKI